ncbi:SufE-like protein 2, chloroplastic [Linum grandiflorum]
MNAPAVAAISVSFNPPNLSPSLTNRKFHRHRFIPRSRIRPISSLERSFPPPPAAGREKKPDLSVHFATAECPPAEMVAGEDVVGERVRILVAEFAALKEPLDRVKRLLDYAGRVPPFDESDRVEENRVFGCTTRVWMVVRLDESGKARFRADSDSEITKGFVSCLVWLLDGASPEDVAAVEAEDLEAMNVGFNGKAPSRVKTWQNVLDSMQKRALDLKGDEFHGRRKVNMKRLIGSPPVTLAGSLPPA